MVDEPCVAGQETLDIASRDGFSVGQLVKVRHGLSSRRRRRRRRYSEGPMPLGPLPFGKLLHRQD